MYYPEELIEEIRIHNDIVDVISNSVPLKKKGNSYFGLCPFHNEKTPSFSVTPDKQMYYCFGCGAGGNVYTFVMEYENFSFLEAVKFLADRVHITLPTPEVSQEVKKNYDEKQHLLEVNKEAAKYFYYQLKSEKGKKALDYLKNRQITMETLKKFGLGYSQYYRDDLYRYLKSKGYEESPMIQAGLVIEDKKEGVHDRFWNRVMFPIFDVHNRVIGFGGRVLGEGNPKYLNSPETKLFDKSKNLYGLNVARTARKGHILIVEGYMDVISLHQAGFNEAVASLGTAFTSGQARLLKRYTEDVLIAYDSDEAGTKAALRAIPILKETGLSVRIIDMTPYKDPDEFINKLGIDAFEERIRTAKNSFLFEIEILEKDYNLTDPEQKTRFVQRIAQKILKLESDIEKDNYIEAISQQYQLNQEHLKALVNQLGATIGFAPPKSTKKVTTKKEKEDGIGQAQRLLLAYLIQEETIYHKIKTFLQPEDFKNPIYQKVATIIYDRYNKGLDVQPAQITNQFTTVEEQKIIAHILNRPLDVTNKQELEKLINETVYKLRRFSLDYASRNAKDVAELQRIISEQSKLQKLHISL